MGPKRLAVDFGGEGVLGEYYLDQSPTNESLTKPDAVVAELRSRISAARAHPGTLSPQGLQYLDA